MEVCSRLEAVLPALDGQYCLLGSASVKYAAGNVDAAFSALTKLGAAFLHWRQRTVNWRLVPSLALGSVPGAFGGVLFLAHLRVIYGNEINDILKSVIGILLVIIPLLLLSQGMFSKPLITMSRLMPSSGISVSLIGLFAGFLA